MASYKKISKELEKLRISNRNCTCTHKAMSSKKKINESYDRDYFPKAVQVKVYSNKSPDRHYWLKHPRQAEMNWDIELNPGTKQFEKVADGIRDSIDDHIEINNIIKVNNKYLERQYELKKDLKELDEECEELTLYHFTSEENVDSIIENNFNWRFSGQARGHKYGHGVSFSPDPDFAEQFCDSDDDVMVVFVVKVLVSSTEIGKPDMVLPKHGDTTVSPKKTVYVKFEDSEFYPQYVVFYERFEY